MKVEELEKLAGNIGLLIKIQVRETLGLCFFRIVIAEQKDNIIKIWAEMKGWTYFNKLVAFSHLIPPVQNIAIFVDSLFFKWVSK